MRVGYLTSGGVGYTMNEGRAIGMGYVAMDAEARKAGTTMAKFIREGTYELEVGGQRVGCRAKLGPLFDPKGRRMKGVYE